MKHIVTEYHSCYDELLSKLFMLSRGLKIGMEDKEAIDNKGKTSVSLISKIDRDGCYHTSFDYTDSKPNEEMKDYDNLFDLTAHEIIVYSLLLHKCIETQSEKQEISYSELQQLRGKRVGKTTLLDSATSKAYDNALKGLCKKRVKYNLGDSKRKKKITYVKAEHYLLKIIDNVKVLSNGDKIIKYSLGKFGQTIIQSGQYSTLVPAAYFKINFKEVMSYQIALYICRIIFMQRRKNKPTTIKLISVMKNTSKFVNSEKYGIVKYGCSLYYYNGENTKRYWNTTIRKVEELLKILKSECKIKDYTSINAISSSHDGTNYDYQNVKWIIHF